MKTNLHFLQKSFITVQAVFRSEVALDALMTKVDQDEQEILANIENRQYTFKAEPSLQLNVGDFALVHANSELKIVQITAVHHKPQIDMNADFHYKWVVDKVNFHGFKRRLLEEAELTEMLNQLDYIEQQKNLLERFETASNKDQGFSKNWQRYKEKNDWLTNDSNMVR